MAAHAEGTEIEEFILPTILEGDDVVGLQTDAPATALLTISSCSGLGCEVGVASGHYCNIPIIQRSPG